ncbi:MAG: GTP-binding protein [Aeromicrobium erythreum]
MIPVVLVTGVDADVMAAATVAVQFDLPQAVTVRHDLDVGAQRLTRVVSDLGGIVEHIHHDLDHACVSCALREDIVPTIERLAASGRWGAVVVHLPTAAEALQVCRVTALDPTAAPSIRVAAVLTAVDGTRVEEDLLGDALLRERGLHTSDDDGRGVGEVLCAMVEYADAVVTVGPTTPQGRALLRTLARPDALHVPDPSRTPSARLVAGLHDHGRTEGWVAPVRRGLLPAPREGIWALDLRSDLPLHPDRLLADIEAIGGGPRRSRGCFWLPSRPGDVGVWDGAGGQLSIGTSGRWGLDGALTRIVVTGLDGDEERGLVEAAFRRCLLSETEVARQGRYWEVAEDGLEPWLGPVRHAA